MDLNKNIVCSCGSGTTAAIVALALDVIGFDQKARSNLRPFKMINEISFSRLLFTMDRGANGDRSKTSPSKLERAQNLKSLERSQPLNAFPFKGLLILEAF